MTNSTFTLAIICGGPSNERGISLNSARSIMDHLANTNVIIQPYYMDTFHQFHEISTKQLYSNTPNDFNFKLQSTSKKLTKSLLIENLKLVDLTFPVIHGEYGEDGQLQALLEQHTIPYIGPSASACTNMFDKYKLQQILKEFGFKNHLQLCITKSEPNKERSIKINSFINTQPSQQYIVKPCSGGSSIGVHSVSTVTDIKNALDNIFKGIDDKAVIEPFIHGKEFTVIVTKNTNNTPVALIPTEIKLHKNKHDIFDYRTKYLASNQVTLHTPPTFCDKIISNIQEQAEQLFDNLQINDFSRFDGWVLEDGSILFSDLNPISGMEQNSFLFQQSAYIGWSHQNILLHIIRLACTRYKLEPPIAFTPSKNKELICTLFGGESAERQVSLMSGTNVWLKINHSKKYNPQPFFLENGNSIWLLPYPYTLTHTVEETAYLCHNYATIKEKINTFRNKVQHKLNIEIQNIEEPQHFTMQAFIEYAKQEKAYVFIALHGGIGENGSLQTIFQKNNIPHNGSLYNGAQICMDKHATGIKITNLQNDHIITAPKIQVNLNSLNTSDINTIWAKLKATLNTNHFIIKPQSDGCSAGIIKLTTSSGLYEYVKAVQNKQKIIPAYTFDDQPTPIELPQDLNPNYLIEAFIETDHIEIQNNHLIHKIKSHCIELTVGVIETNGIYTSFSPSITVAEGNVLSLEEKFQGGTGINLTPPPQDILSQKDIEILKSAIEKTAKACQISNYARIDVFYNYKTKQTIIIEINALPALTGSTVIYHQALEENLNPKQFLEDIIERSYYKNTDNNTFKKAGIH